MISAKTKIDEPVKPSSSKRIINTITFGVAYKNDISKYQYELQSYKNEQQIEQLVSMQADRRKPEAENEGVNNNRIPFDCDKLKEDLENDKVSQKQKLQLISEVIKNLKNNKSITTKAIGLTKAYFKNNIKCFSISFLLLN